MIRCFGVTPFRGDGEGRDRVIHAAYIRKMMIPRHGSLQSVSFRFNWMLQKEFYRHILIARLFEAQIVGHVIVIDSR